MSAPSNAQRLTPSAFLRLQAAVRVMNAARRKHGEGMIPLAHALESAGLLQSPEAAADVERLRKQVASRAENSERLAKCLVDRTQELTAAEARIAELERVRSHPPRRFDGVPADVLEAALRDFVCSHLDYDMHKYIEAPEDGSPDRYPELARELAKGLTLEAEAAGYEVEPWDGDR